MVGNPRQSIIERYLPGSMAHVVGRFGERRRLGDGQEFDHLAVARGLVFAPGRNFQVLSFFFLLGVGEEGRLGYEFHAVLTPSGEIERLRDFQKEKLEGGGKMAVSNNYTLGVTETWKLDAAVERMDDFLKQLTEAAEFVRLPADHSLMRSINLKVSVRTR